MWYHMTEVWRPSMLSDAEECELGAPYTFGNFPPITANDLWHVETRRHFYDEISAMKSIKTGNTAAVKPKMRGQLEKEEKNFEMFTDSAVDNSNQLWEFLLKLFSFFFLDLSDFLRNLVRIRAINLQTVRPVWPIERVTKTSTKKKKRKSD